jgi:hypothetical protein
MFKVQKFNVAQQDEEKDRPFSVILCPAGNFVPQVDARRSSRNFGSFGFAQDRFWILDFGFHESSVSSRQPRQSLWSIPRLATLRHTYSKSVIANALSGNPGEFRTELRQEIGRHAQVVYEKRTLTIRGTFG